MAIALYTHLDSVLHLSKAMLDGDWGDYSDSRRQFIEVVYRNAQNLLEDRVLDMTMEELANKSHDLRQLLTAMVGYSALLNSPKLSDHSELTEIQLKQIHNLHEACRFTHWRLDGLIMFADQIVRPNTYKAQDAGMLSLGGYIRAQVDNYVCRKYVSQVNIADDMPSVYANDTHTKLMLRGLFAVAIDLRDNPNIQVSSYTMMKFIRMKLTIVDAGDEFARLQEMVQKLNANTSETLPTPQITVSKVQEKALIELGLHIATTLALKQGGRIKLSSDTGNLVFTLTMPTSVPQ